MTKALGTITLAVSILLTAACDQAAPAASTQAPAPAQAAAPAKQLTVEDALVAGGKADAKAGFGLESALYNSNSHQICYTFFAEGVGHEYELVNLEGHAWTYWHSNGLEEHSSGRTSYWEADEQPCDTWKRIWKDGTPKVIARDLMLTPVQNACMNKVDNMPLGTDKQMATVKKAINACFDIK